MKEENNINFNKSECIKEYDKLGTTIYKNICNGEKTEVPWGFSVWFMGIGFTLFILAIIICFYRLIKEMLK